MRLCNDSTPAAEAPCTRAAAPNVPYCSTFPPGAQWFPIPEGPPCEAAATASEAAHLVAAASQSDPGQCQLLR